MQLYRKNPIWFPVSAEGKYVTGMCQCQIDRTKCNCIGLALNVFPVNSKANSPSGQLLCEALQYQLT